MIFDSKGTHEGRPILGFFLFIIVWAISSVLFLTIFVSGSLFILSLFL